ncbi:hypothetical protein ARMSODRAFT_964764 [Armillaria solidipes]|uniref:Uncharacterized protein n=1 Tax=Armillaria solidipes TaxID=1076256 RepID=A0A2H3AS67_9AGAR|nr:hypothetical protein ARMSODRAFT_964764 [Armillaria solidipes]
MIEIQWSKPRILELQYEYVSPSWQASVPPSVPKFGTRAPFYTSLRLQNNAVGYSESIVLCKKPTQNQDLGT